MNDLYTKAREALLRGEWSWTADDFVVAYLDDTYDPDLDADEFATAVEAAVIDSAPIAGAVITTTPQVGTAAIVAADAADVTTLVVPIGKTIAAIAIWKDTGDLATSPLILLDDENEDYTPIGRPGTGVAVPLLWSSSPERVFAI